MHVYMQTYAEIMLDIFQTSVTAGTSNQLLILAIIYAELYQ